MPVAAKYPGETAVTDGKNRGRDPIESTPLYIEMKLNPSIG